MKGFIGTLYFHIAGCGGAWLTARMDSRRGEWMHVSSEYAVLVDLK